MTILARMKSTARFVAPSVVLLFLLVGVGPALGMSDTPAPDRGDTNDASPTAPGKAMPQFALESAADGTVVSSASFKGQVLLVTFFATWCTPCLEEIPSLKKLQTMYSPKGFSVLALSMDQGGSKIVKALMDKEKINYPVLMADRAVARGFGGVPGIPIAFIINRDGGIVNRHLGYVGQEVLEREVAALIE